MKSLTSQADADAIAQFALNKDGLSGSPQLQMPTYVRFISPDHGFGVFCAAAVNVDASRPTSEPIPDYYIGSYGGFVCTYTERHDDTEIYEIAGKLVQDPDKQRRYVHLFLVRPFIYRGLQANLDGCDMRAGDGKFINCGCNPNVSLDLAYCAYCVGECPSSSATTLGRISITNLIYPTRCDIALMACCSILMPRSIRACDQLILSYEKPTKQIIRRKEKLGGAVRPEQCQCGCVFCCGDILRRLECDMLCQSDTYFFNNTVGPLSLCIQMIKQANECWADVAAVTDDDKVKFLRRMFPTMTDVPRANSLYNSFVKEGLKSRALAHYMMTLARLDVK